MGGTLFNAGVFLRKTLAARQTEVVCALFFMKSYMMRRGGIASPIVGIVKQPRVFAVWGRAFMAERFVLFGSKRDF
jgi:hypothetical protein